MSRAANASKVQPPTASKRPPNAGKGRKKGVPNRATSDIKAAIAAALNEFGPQLPALLRKVAQRNPARAVELVAKLAEYTLPKLGRVQIAGDHDAPMQTITRIEIVGVQAATHE